MTTGCLTFRCLCQLCVAGMCCLALPANAAPPTPENLDEMIMRLGADDFDEREAATDELGKLPAGYARVFLKLSESITADLEIRDRLILAARKIFERQIGGRDERWLRLHGSLNVSYQAHFCRPRGENENEREPLGMAICWVDDDGACGKALKGWDVITEVDGMRVGGRDLDQLVKPGSEYELTVRRYKDTTKIADRDYVENEDKDFEEFKVKVVAGWRRPESVDQDYAAVLMASLWSDFLTEYRSPANQKFAALK